MVSKGQFVGLDWNRITRLHSQVKIGTQEVKNSLTASRCHLKAYQRCGQPTSKVSMLKMKQQQHDINLRRTRKKIRVPDGINQLSFKILRLPRTEKSASKIQFLFQVS